ncbi:hypothetical protein SDRG_03222 [Saprolegnia diclina VS20]|uniref:Ricin B lectin domain-containing protein n=1 Tax=Saprolegnia diclina (strain VS20) TaxID=1156394 RepID=T0QNV3_SAPDV|nr:hypothetical protein SDRG_03222 [Saprolegnia diclina VS20]EQC39799.1 hypothetical protein SDRG_03222 [Saprolegnia diclina VS20]|eukprot:XP_008607071.1 hypothetical protein SDRG_03222 [Saprolegnia diclina VS20]
MTWQRLVAAVAAALPEWSGWTDHDGNTEGDRPPTTMRVVAVVVVCRRDWVRRWRPTQISNRCQICALLGSESIDCTWFPSNQIARRVWSDVMVSRSFQVLLLGLSLLGALHAGWISGEYSVGNSVRDWTFRLAVDGSCVVALADAADRWRVYASRDGGPMSMMQRATDGRCLTFVPGPPSPSIALTPCCANSTAQQWHMAPHALRSDWIAHSGLCVTVYNEGSGHFGSPVLEPCARGRPEQQMYFFA